MIIFLCDDRLDTESRARQTHMPAKNCRAAGDRQQYTHTWYGSSFESVVKMMTISFIDRCTRTMVANDRLAGKELVFGICTSASSGRLSNST